MIAQPRLSIVIPTHNRAHLLRRAVNSALTQTLDHLEVVIVDDASSDDTGRMVASYEDERVVYVRREQSGSAAAARNTGINRARAPLVAFLDDDDELLPEFAASMLAAFETARETVGLGWCGTITVEDREDGEVTLGSGVWRPVFPDREVAYRSFLRSRRIGTNCGITVRKSCLTALGGFDERMQKAEDTDFLIRAVRQFDFLVVPKTLVRIHKHSGPNLTVYDQAMAQAYEVILAKNEETLTRYPGLSALLHYKTGWLHYHGGNRRRAREHMLRSLRSRPFSPKTWSAIIMHELLGSRARRLHASLSRLRRLFRRDASMHP